MTFPDSSTGLSVNAGGVTQNDTMANSKLEANEPAGTDSDKDDGLKASPRDVHGVKVT